MSQRYKRVTHDGLLHVTQSMRSPMSLCEQRMLGIRVVSRINIRPFMLHKGAIFL